jgi:hypothetical protein
MAMKSGRLNTDITNSPHKQRGVVLLIALIVLVAMTLAGIGMMRSVDTGSMIAGNMAFRQATSNANDAGISAGFNALVSVANTANAADPTILQFNGDNTVPCAGNVTGATAAGCGGGGNINLPGYYPIPMTFGGVGGTCEVDKTCTQTRDYTWWTNDAYWAAANAPTITITDPNGGIIATVSYLIHRMCKNPGPKDTTCQFYTPPCRGGDNSNTFSSEFCPIQTFYRITSRAVGPRNSVTYSQVLVLI